MQVSVMYASKSGGNKPEQPCLQMDPSEVGGEAIEGLEKVLGLPKRNAVNTSHASVVGTPLSTSSGSVLRLRGGGPKAAQAKSAGGLDFGGDGKDDEASEEEDDFRPLTLEDFQSMLVEDPQAERLALAPDGRPRLAVRKQEVPPSHANRGVA